MVFEVPDALLQEYADELQSRFGVEITSSRISQILIENNISRKVVSP